MRDRVTQLIDAHPFMSDMEARAMLMGAYQIASESTDNHETQQRYMDNWTQRVCLTDAEKVKNTISMLQEYYPNLNQD